MSDQTPSWLQEYQRPFVNQYNVQCRSGHLHQSNMPATGLVLVRLDRSWQVEVLLELRSGIVDHADTFGFIGGTADRIDEEPQVTAYREAQQEYGITPEDLTILGFQYKRDHGGIKCLNYTYIFAEYNPPNGEAPASRTSETVRSRWFPFRALPGNLIPYIKEDMRMLQHILHTEIEPRLVAARHTNSPIHRQARQAQASIVQRPLTYPATPKRKAPMPATVIVGETSGGEMSKTDHEAPARQGNPKHNPNDNSTGNPSTSNAGIFFPKIPEDHLPANSEGVSNAGVFFPEIPGEYLLPNSEDVSNAGVFFPELPEEYLPANGDDVSNAGVFFPEVPEEHLPADAEGVSDTGLFPGDSLVDPGTPDTIHVSQPGSPTLDLEVGQQGGKDQRGATAPETPEPREQGETSKEPDAAPKTPPGRSIAPPATPWAPKKKKVPRRIPPEINDRGPAFFSVSARDRSADPGWARRFSGL